MSDLIIIKESKNYPGLFVKKYKKSVFYKNLWNKDKDLVESRGKVVDKKGATVVNPFTKVFNQHENNTNIDRDEHCLAIEKINGFMAAVTWVPQINDVVVSTTGSLDSDYVELAKEMLPNNVFEYIKNHKESKTYLFEIVHPNDPHIIKEQKGAYLIGSRWVNDDKPYFTNKAKEKHLDHIAKQMKVLRPRWSNGARFSDITDNNKSSVIEGYMVYGQSSKTVLKLKSPYYLNLKAIARKKDILSLDKKRVDEEYYPLLDHIKSLGQSFIEKDEQTKLSYIREWLEHNN